MTFAPVLLGQLSAAEQAQIAMLGNQLAAKAMPNRLKTQYYEGTQLTRDLGIAIPPMLRDVETVVGWPGTVVDVLEERLDWESFGWRDRDDDDLGIGEIVEDNHLVDEIPQGILDALIYGIAFGCVGTGYDGEPGVLVTIESPLTMTVRYDRRSRRISAALAVVWDDERGQAASVTLYLPNETIVAERRTPGGTLTVTHRDQHNLGRVLVSRLVNRRRAADLYGRSEITRAVRALTDNAVRTLLGMEVSREFYAAPQRYALGADERAFQDADGNPRPGWASYLGRVWGLTPAQAEDGSFAELEVGQFPATPMTPYVEQVRLLAHLLSAEGGIPANYLGFVTENPASADAIRAGEARLVKRAERRIRGFAGDLVQLGELALLARDGVAPPKGLYARFGDPATPTAEAAADRAVKLIAAGVLLPDSEVTHEMLGFDADTRARLAVDARRARATAMVRALTPPQPALPAGAVTSPPG